MLKFHPARLIAFGIASFSFFLVLPFFFAEGVSRAERNVLQACREMPTVLAATRWAAVVTLRIAVRA